MIASPPVQPISSSSSGTGSVRTTALPKFVWRPPRGHPVPHTFRASTTSRARTTPPGVSSTVGEPARSVVTGVCSNTWTPLAIAARLSARTSRAGCTVAPSRKMTPLRKRGESHRRLTSAVSSSVASSSTPSAATASYARSTSTSSDSPADTSSMPPSRNQMSSPRLSQNVRTAGTIRAEACASCSAAPSPITCRSVGSDDQ